MILSFNSEMMQSLLSVKLLELGDGVQNTYLYDGAVFQAFIVNCHSASVI